ncbi:MAG: substrate-binding domain-containing protein [Succinivibrionaceae bacterium]|nr:substrate-binding domain-containing protein [Succinivibrionaceae bacterium]
MTGQVALALALASCLVTAPVRAQGTGEGARVDYIASDGRDYFIHGLSQALQAAFAAEGYELEVHDSHLDATAQARLLDSCATASEGPLIITPVGDDPTPLARLGDDVAPMITARGLIIFGSVPGPGQGDRPVNSWFISSNPYAIGEQQGNYLLRYLDGHPGIDRNRDGAIDTVLLNGMLSNLNASGRRQGFVDAVGSSLRIGELNAGWNGERAEQLLGEYLQGHPGGPEVVVAANDEMALGAIRALRAAGLNRPGAGDPIPVLGVDGLQEMVRAIASGEATATLRHDQAQMAGAALGLYKILATGTFPAPGEVALELDQEAQVLWLPPHEVVDREILQAVPRP